MTLDELNKLVRDVVNVVTTATDVVEYYPNAPRPDNDYATVNVAELVRIGTVDRAYISAGEDLSEKVVMQYEAMVSVNFYRENARQNAAILGGSMRNTSIVQMLNVFSVGFVRPSSVRDLTQLIDQGHEERGQVDLFLHFELTPILETVVGVDTVNVSGEVDDGVEVVELIEITTP